MNNEIWNALNDKVAQRDELQAQLDQVRGEIGELATKLQQQLEEYRQKTEAVPEA